jgi:ABC-2 type transport system ATP-binding protein
MSEILDRAPGGGAEPSLATHARDLAVSARGLTKHYRNPWTLKVTRGLDALDLEVRRGEIVGYLGPNGAGKTTTLKLLTGLLKPTHGRAWLFGLPIDDPESRRSLGFLPEQPYFYDFLNGRECLELAGRLSGLHGAEADARARHWLGRVGLADRPTLRLRKYSKGMLQRLGLAAALLHEPQLLILDEPMSGLDPFGRRDVRELILEQRERGVTVLFSSHILPDVEMLCDRVAIVMAGRLVRLGTVSELLNRGQTRVEIRCTGAPLVEVPAGLAGVLTRFEHPEGTAFMLADETRVNDVVQWLARSGARLRAVTPHRATLEELFMAAAAEGGPNAGPTHRSERSA